MIRVALRGLAARRLRLALTVLAVALGITLIAGTYVFTDTINASFDRIFSESYRTTDAVVTPRKTVTNDDEDPPPMPASVLDAVRRAPGAAQAEGGIFSQGGTVIGHDGKPIGHGGAPQFIASLHHVPRFEVFSVARGRAPRSADEVAFDKATADREGFRLGERIPIGGVTPKKPYRLVGILKIAGVDSFGGASVAVLDLAEAQRVAGERGRFDEVDVAGRSGVSPTELKRQLRSVVGRRVTVRTGQEQAASQSRDIRDNLGFLRTALLAFAGISLFVGAFIIFNTFSITVAQRTREFALLRTLGASRRQVLRSVLLEGFVLGALGSAAGLGLGILLASGLKALFRAIGLDLPSNGTVIATRTVVVSLLVGTLVTLLSSLAPALRATRVPPVAALREGAVLPPGRGRRFATPLAIALTALGLALMLVGLFGSAPSGTALGLTGAGAAVIFVGVALLSPRLVVPIASVLGLPLERAFGVTGRLARENSIRQPGRTAATAAALMVGVALVAFASIFAASARTTIRDAVHRGSKAQAILQNSQGFGSFSPDAARAVAGVGGVAEVSAVRFGTGRIAGKDTGVTGIDPRTFSRLYRIDGAGALDRLGPGEVAVAKGYADKHHTKVGDTLRVATPAQRTVTLRVVGIVDDKGHLTRDLTITSTAMEHDFSATRDGFVLIAFAPGSHAKAVQAAISRMLKRAFPQVEVLTNDEFIANQANQIDQLLYLIYALLALAVIVSLFGIVNTLVLSISERTRELGMLRAIGTSRRQVRRMVRYEAVITSLIGGILGAVLGVVLAVLVSRVVEDFSLTVPIAAIVVLLVLAGLAGVGAAVLPARRAARLNVLDALAYE